MKTFKKVKHKKLYNQAYIDKYRVAAHKISYHSKN